MNNNTWQDDLLNREEEGTQLINYLVGRYEKNLHKPFVLNINAEWGYGKTFFLNNLALELKSKNYDVVEFDAWKNDYTKEPLLAFMSELNISLEEFFNKKQTKAKGFLQSLKKNSLPILMSVLSRKLTGYSLDELSELDDEQTESMESVDINDNSDIEKGVSSITSKLTEYALHEHNTIKNSIEEFKKSMIKLLKYIETLKGHQLPLFILIDELDRCRPNYAIELLENIKHLFDIEGIIFIIATDSKQLSHSINAVYGEKFESEKYLKRFFDQEYNLKIPSNHEYITSLFNENNILLDPKLLSPLEENHYQGKNKNVELFCIYAEAFNLVPRDINQVFTSLITIIMSWTYQEKIHLAYLLFLIMLKQKNNIEFTNYINKKCNTTEVFNNLELKQTEVSTLHRVQDGYNNKQFKIAELIEKYNELRDIRYSSFLNKKKNSSYRILGQLYNEIYHEISAVYDDDTIIDIKLNKYSDLVLYAGQFN